MRYRKKPVVIDAVQFTGDLTAIQNFVGDTVISLAGDNNIVIPTLEGCHLAKRGDYIIRGIKGEYYPCKPDIFEATYELVNE